MKVFFVSIALLMITFLDGFAQTEKGSQTLGLTFGLNLSESERRDNPEVILLKIKNTNFSIGPSYSYFIKKNLDIGLNLGYTYNNNKTQVISTQRSDYIEDQSFEVGTFIRKYFLVSKNFGIRNGAYLNYEGGKNERFEWVNDAPNLTNGEFKNYTGGLLFDLVFYPAKKFGLASNIVNVFVYHQKDKFDGGTVFKTNGLSATAFSSLNITLFRVF